MINGGIVDDDMIDLPRDYVEEFNLDQPKTMTTLERKPLFQ